MTRPVDELAALVADVRALLDAAAAAGHTVLPDQGLPEPAPRAEASPETAESKATPPARRPARASAWSAIAREERDAAPISKGAEAQPDDGRVVIYQGQYTVVFGLGDPSADLVVAYQVPGFRGNRAARPYEGPAGEMLEKMLVHVLGLGRDQVYLLGVGDCHPRDGQSPPRTELAACRATIRQQLDAVRPKAMLVFGGVAFRTLFNEPASALHQSRGSWRELGGVEVMPTYHPAHLLRQPSEKRAVFQDLKTLRTRYDALGGRH